MNLARNCRLLQCDGGVFGRVHDIDLWVTDSANFAFYVVVARLLLKAFGRSKTIDT
jgi:hypothetical protein